MKLSNKEINEVYQNVLQEVLVDAGIAVSTIDILSQSLGYGSTIIGGIGSVNPMGAVDYLKLPKYNIPLVGITMGKNNNKNILKKPKQSFETSIFFEEYDNELATKGVLEYNENLKKYWETLNLNLPNHLDVIESYIKGSMKENFQNMLIKQGIKK